MVSEVAVDRRPLGLKDRSGAMVAATALSDPEQLLGTLDPEYCKEGTA